MAEIIMMKHPQTGEIKKGVIGYSWTVCFWGWIPMLCRGDLLSGGLFLGLELLYWNFAQDPSSAGLVITVAQIIGGFTYNKRYTRGLIDKGFRFNDVEIRNQAGAAALGMSLEACAMTQNAAPKKDTVIEARNTAAQAAPVCEAAPAMPQSSEQPITETATESSTLTTENRPIPSTTKTDMMNTETLGKLIMGLVIVGVVLTFLINKEKIMNTLMDETSSHSTLSTSSSGTSQPRLTPQGQPLRSSDENIQRLECFDGKSSISLNGELAEMFNLGSNYTDVQRERTLQKLKGNIVRWTSTVYEVSSIGKRKYKILPTAENSVSVVLYVTALDDEDVRYIESLKTGSSLTFTAMFTGEQMFRALEMKPAIVNRPVGTATSNARPEPKSAEVQTPPVQYEAVPSTPAPSDRKGRVLNKTTIIALYCGLDEDAPETIYVFEDEQGVKYYLKASDEEEALLQRYRGKKMTVTYTTETFYHEGGQGMMKDDFLQSYQPLH
jgi:hypothetical protein